MTNNSAERNCKKCGKIFHAKVYNNRPSTKKFCSVRCSRKSDKLYAGYSNRRARIRERYRTETRPKIQAANNSYRCVVCGSKLSERGRADRKYCSEKCRSRKYHKEHREEHRLYTRLWAQRHRSPLDIAKRDERGSLRRAYGTTRVPLVCKKVCAIRRAIKNSALTSAIGYISEGVTHEAYL
jgi:hypothetical protein